MTKQETYGIRSNRLSNFFRKNLPDSSTGFQISDLDFALFNFSTRKFLIAEEKCRLAEPTISQRMIFKKLAKWLTIGSAADEEGWKFLGIHLIQLTGEGLDDGPIYFDRKLITKEQLIEVLSLK